MRHFRATSFTLESRHVVSETTSSGSRFAASAMFAQLQATLGVAIAVGGDAAGGVEADAHTTDQGTTARLKRRWLQW